MQSNDAGSAAIHAICQRIDIRLSLLIRAILALAVIVLCAAWWLP